MDRAPEMYDDEGRSGGTIERPALQRLLSDIKAGKVEIIVVYKFDREAFSNATLFSSLRVPDPVFLIVTYPPALLTASFVVLIVSRAVVLRKSHTSYPLYAGAGHCRSFDEMPSPTFLAR